MRFNDPGYVTTWAETGRFPKIHDDITDLILSRGIPSGAVLDLCASTGLLGRRIADALKCPSVAVEADERAVETGIRFSVYPGEVIPLRITPETFPTLASALAEHRVKTVLARRCILELAEFVDTQALGRLFSESGVETIFLEGHVASNRTVNPLITPEAQAAALGWGIHGEPHRNCRQLLQA